MKFVPLPEEVSEVSGKCITNVGGRLYAIMKDHDRSGFGIADGVAEALLRTRIAIKIPGKD